MFSLCKRLGFARFVFKPPRVADVLIYDSTSSKDLRHLFQPSTTIETLFVRKECLNIPALVCSIFTVAFWRLALFDAYVISYARLVAPKLIITFIDNDCRFYRIHSRLKNSRNRPIFVSIQNGFREKEVIIDLLSDKHFRGQRPSCDHIFVFNADYQRFITRHISTAAHVSGSLRNNINAQDVVHCASKDKPQNVLFISQWRPGKPHSFIEPEAALIPMISQWCESNGLRLYILACRPTTKEGASYYQQFLLNNVTLIENNSPGSSFAYRWVDSVDLIVAIDSALGLEAVARGKPFAVFPIRGKSYSSRRNLFFHDGYPSHGRHWSAKSDHDSVKRILDNLLSDYADWTYYYDRYQHLMPLDPGAADLKNQIARLMNIRS